MTYEKLTSINSRSISLIISTRVLYEASEEAIELMKARVLSVFITINFIVLNHFVDAKV